MREQTLRKIQEKPRWEATLPPLNESWDAWPLPAVDDNGRYLDSYNFSK